MGFPVKYGNAERFHQIIADDINAHGGIAGRRLQIVTWEYDANTYANVGDLFAAECTHFTQDVEVFTVITPLGDERSFKCYGDAHMPFFEEKGSMSDARIIRRYPHYFSTGSMNLSRIARLMASGFARQGFFFPGGKVGLVTFDLPILNEVVKNDLIPALAQQGVVLDQIAQVTLPESKEQTGKMFADAAATATKFCADGIDRVMFLDIGDGNLGGPFSQAAEGQRCRRFRYGLTSWDFPSARVESTPFWAQEQLRAQGGAIGVGWRPNTDIGLKARQGPDMPQTARRCIDLMQKAGVTFSEGCCEWGAALTACNKLWFLKAAIEAGGGSKAVNAETFRIGAESLGTRFRPTTGFLLDFGPKRHDGVAAYRDMHWDDACSCLDYVGPIRRAP